MGVSFGKPYELPASVKIIGTGTGAANTATIGFYQSDGVTRLGWIGDGGTGSEDLAFNALGGNVSIGTPNGYVEVLTDGTVTFAKQGNLLIGYTYPTLANSWSDYGGSPAYQYAAYYKTIDGMVHLTGVIKGGSNGNIFTTTLPSGCLPGNKIAFNINCGTGYQNGYLTVDTSGNVAVNVPSGANTWVVLDGCQWRGN